MNKSRVYIDAVHCVYKPTKRSHTYVLRGTTTQWRMFFLLLNSLFLFFVLLPSKRRTKTRIVVDRKRKTKIHTLNYSRSSHSHRKKIAKQKQENRETAEIEMVSMKMRKHRYLFNISQFALMDFQFCSFIVRHARFHYIFFFLFHFSLLILCSICNLAND